MRLLIFTLCSCFVCSFAYSRPWVSTSGHIVEGDYVSATSMTVTIYLTQENKAVVVELNKLSEGDVKYVKQMLKGGASALHSGDIDRSVIPSLDQRDFRSGNKSCGPVALLNFILWWGNTAFPQIKPSGNERQQMKKIHRSLVGFCKSSTGGTFVTDLARGAKEYFEKKVEGYTVDIEHRMAPDLDWFQTHATGYNAVIALHGYYNLPSGKREGGHFTSIIGVDGNNVLLNTDGSRYSLLLSEVSLPGRGECYYEYTTIGEIDFFPRRVSNGVLEEAIVLKLRKL